MFSEIAGITPGSSPRHPSTKDPTDYLKIARKGGRGNPGLKHYLKQALVMFQSHINMY